MSIEAVDHVNIRASAGDLARLKRFYCDVVGLGHLVFRCESLEPFKQKLQTLGIEYQLSCVAELGNEQLLFRDPVGMGVELSVSA